MGQDTRAEIDKLHGSMSDLKERVVNLEAQIPHINSSLGRIEKLVEKVNGHMTRGAWAIITLFIAAVWKLITSGAIPGI